MLRYKTNRTWFSCLLTSSQEMEWVYSYNRGARAGWMLHYLAASGFLHFYLSNAAHAHFTFGIATESFCRAGWPSWCKT